MHIHDESKTTVLPVTSRNTYLNSGRPQSRRKKFPGVFHSPNYTFPEVIATESIHDNGFHISKVIPHQLLLMWLTTACCHILLKSTVFVHQIHLAAYGVLDTGCTRAQSVFPEDAQNSLRIPWVFHVHRNPWLFQVFQVCDHPVNRYFCSEVKCWPFWNSFICRLICNSHHKIFHETLNMSPHYLLC